MDKFDWKVTIKTNILLLEMAGLWPKEGTYKLDIYTLYALVSITLLLLGDVFFQTTNIFFILNDLEAITGVIYILLTKMVAIVKVYHFVKKVETVKHLMETLNSETFQPKNSKQKRLIKPVLNKWKTLFRTLFNMSWVAVIFWGVFPIWDKSTEERRLPFLAWYPYNAQISPLYEITYVYQVASIAYCAIVSVGVDAFIAALNMFTGAQFDILCDNLSNIDCENDIKESNLKLRNCINHHKLILSFGKTCNDFFNWIIFLQFFVSAVTIGMTMFQLTVVVPFSTEFYCLLFFEYAILVAIFMYCWFGNEVQVKSEQVPYAIFRSNWIDAPLKTKKNIIFFCLRCRQPFKMSALKLFYLSVETFVKIIRTAYSYFALLNQVNS